MRVKKNQKQHYTKLLLSAMYAENVELKILHTLYENGNFKNKHTADILGTYSIMYNVCCIQYNV